MNTKIFSAGLVIGLAMILSCTSDDSGSTTLDCTTNKPTYTNNIAAIMNTSCATTGCHNAATKAAGYDLSTYNATKSASANSKFLKSIKHESGADKMPQGGSKLSDATINQIECWINNGTPQ